MTRGAEEFPLLDLKYSDDTTVLFNPRENQTKGACSIMSHFYRLGIK